MSPSKTAAKKRIFLLSPANLAGRRAEILLREAAKFDLATRVRVNGAPIGELFSFISGLYFRGKLAYATAFSEKPKARHSIFIITATRGLVAPHVIIDVGVLVEMAGVPINCSDPRYRAPLERDLAKLARRTGKSAEVILLGSIATPKYLEPLSRMFGERLLIPTEFVGRGDMSRGAMMLRAVRSMVPLAYAPVLSLEAGHSR
ncbi:MAG: hypothetical protein ACRD40_03365 [Candidatus Acidiferrales bacterium]